jgi:hypothetical protein
MAYITSTELGTYLYDKGFVSEELSAADETRLLNSAIGEWEGLVGCRPFLAVSSTKVFDPRDIQADRRGWVLDLAVPISAAPTLVKSGVSTNVAGTTLVQWDDWQLPDYTAPYTQLIFRTKPYIRLEITAAWGYTDANGIDDQVNDAIYCLASARAIEEGAGRQGAATRIKTGLIEIQNSESAVQTLRKRAAEIARGYWLS